MKTFKGKIENVRIFNRNLTEKEIKMLMIKLSTLKKMLIWIKVNFLKIIKYLKK